MIKSTSLLAVAVVVSSPLLSRSAHAYRPFDSTDASVAEAGEFELEAGPAGYLRIGPSRYLVAPALVANLGLFDRCEAVLQGRELILLEGVSGEAHTRWNNNEASLKFVLRKGSLQGESGVSIGTELGLLLPGQSEPGIGASGTLLVSQRWSFATLHLSLAAERTRESNPGVITGAIVEGPFDWWARPVGELLFEDEIDGERRVSGLVGAILRVNDNLVLDAAIRVARDELEARAGLTWTLPVWGEPHP
jgi:hypothetical protein